MKNIKDILKENLVWRYEQDSIRFYISDQYPKEVCKLRMNDFPDEPMWTLFYSGESIDFDDEPKTWKIHYRLE